jgi:hypothetical protein
MKRREFITTFPVALGATMSSALPAKTSVPAGSVTQEVNVKRDFGAKGDGTTDDWRAIENAGMFLQSRGGGRMYFPAGRYKLPTFGKNITVRDNVEYCGDGHSSVIIGSNAAFVSPNGAIFGRNSYAKYRYYGAHDIRAGSQSIITKVADDADNFIPGDIIIARSITAITSPGDVLPFFVEMNRVVSVNDGVINLEDPIDDGWNGIMVAKVTDDVSQGYSIHDLRIECEHGIPLFIQASYKSVIRNCWTRGFSVTPGNGFTRSVAHDIIATVLWSPGQMGSLIEIETGSVRASVHDIEVHMAGVAVPDGQYPLFYCQEFSRRTSVRNIRVAGSGVAMGNIIQAFAGGHTFENIEVVAKAIDKILDYSSADPARFSLNHLPTTIKGITVETREPDNGFKHGFVLYNNYPGGTVENVTIQDCSINGVTDQGDHNLIWFLRGEQSNILFENVRGAGDVRMSRPDGEASDTELKNVQIRNCEFRRIASAATLRQASFVNCRRKNGPSPRLIRFSSASAWVNSSADKSMLAFAVPASAEVCTGDRIEVRLSGWYAGTFNGHVVVKAFGATVIRMDLVPSAFQTIEINMWLHLAGESFNAPDKFVVTGAATVNDGIVPGTARFIGSLTARLNDLIELQVWTDRTEPKDFGFFIKNAAIEYVLAED